MTAQDLKGFFVKVLQQASTADEATQLHQLNIRLLKRQLEPPVYLSELHRVIPRVAIATGLGDKLVHQVSIASQFDC